VIRARQLTRMTPLLEGVLSRVSRRDAKAPEVRAAEMFPIVPETQAMGNRH